MRIKCYLYEFRTNHNMTLRQVAMRTGISFSNLNYIENNKTIPRIDTAYELAELFKVSVYELFRIEK